ncbi:MAG: 1-deoxy-D-xylulose-5-phosphate reductoisomerase [Candidatus Fermentithermobacillus carboniphilus]|uniref:1-deoxy-D-xylulose 5-phosphate reductoisomerase n=1 Tax=Candidatus Fermentithermobacillus carboniphilus TaxID=3085328 RepID=A0AAT9LER7_9FIRM|nr:MAG: 1-deoxy-D-xylulose-5-phosphate reductoisomerase [Candidatus Fermentithermobacillus carboniphilus]
MKTISLLGSTGSIGKHCLEVVAQDPELKVVALAAGKDWQSVLRQAKDFGVRVVAFWDEEAASKAESEKHALGLSRLEIRASGEGVESLATLEDADIVVHAIPGFRGIRPLLSALARGKKVAFAGKEALVSAGDLVAPYLRKDRSLLIPVDSEHSAIFQCLQGERLEDVDEIILTASGGAFRDRTLDEMRAITKEEALCHPTWKMGPKVTVDSATLFNKTLEVIEAHHLFGVGYERIRVVIHRESVIHSMVMFRDGSVKAQLAVPDMKLPISYALHYPQRGERPVPKLWPILGKLSFELPDTERFPCLTLGYEAGRIGGTAPCVLSYADEVLVGEFLAGRIGFLDIYRILKKVLDMYEPREVTCVEVLEEEVRRMDRVIRDMLLVSGT